MSCRVVRLVCAIALLVAAPARAQTASEPPAHVSFVDGGALLERDGQPDASPENMPILAGDRLRTESGRLEVLFADGSTLHLDASTTVDFESDALVRLLAGRVRLAIPGSRNEVEYRIDAPAASVSIEAPGEYRVSVQRTAPEPEVELEVLRGSAELVNDEGRTPLRAGQRATARAHLAPSYAYAFNSASWDAFDRWSEARRDQRLGVSTQYLPQEIRPYAASFDRDGAWRYETSYGYVWYPTVSVGWRPYRDGRWVSLRPYGWTWVGADVWDWPTHHYGRWGLSDSAWFWIPGRDWAPAWVSWAYAPGYVSWCPLGWDNRAVVQIVSAPGRGYEPWRAWTAVADRHFGRGNVHDVGVRHVDPGPRGFVARESAPEARDYAVPRSAAPIRIAGTGAPRRAGSPVYTNLEPGASRVAGGPSRTVVGPSRSAAGIPERSAGEQRDRAYAVPRAAGSNATSQPAPHAADASSATLGRDGVSAPAAPTNGVRRDRWPASPSMPGTAIRRVDSPSGETGRARTDEGRPGSPVETPRPSGERSRPAPYEYPQYGGPPRAVPREGPAYRPAPAPPENGSSNGTAAHPPVPSTHDTRPHDAPPAYGGPAPADRRAPEHPPDSVGHAVPRPESRGDHPAPESRPSGGVERRAPAADRPAGTASGDGRPRSGGRGR